MIDTNVSVSPALRTKETDWSEFCIHVLLAHVVDRFSCSPDDIWATLAGTLETEAHLREPAGYRITIAVNHYRLMFARVTEARVHTTDTCAACAGEPGFCAVHTTQANILDGIDRCLYMAWRHESNVGEYGADAARRFCRAFTPDSSRDGIVLRLLAQPGWTGSLAETYVDADAILLTQ